MIFTIFSVRVAYGRGSVLLRQHDEIPRGRDNFGGFLPVTMPRNAFAANGIGREGGDGSAQCGRSVFSGYVCQASFDKILINNELKLQHVVC